MAGTLRVPSIANRRWNDVRTAHGVCLLLRLLLILLVLPIGSRCLAQDGVVETEEQAASADQTDQAVEANQERKQRTAATAISTLVGIALTGILLMFIVVVLGAWVRRMAHAGRADREAAEPVAEEPAVTEEVAGEDAEPQPPDEDKP